MERVARITIPDRKSFCTKEMLKMETMFFFC
jgi:hypothetical protein